MLNALTTPIKIVLPVVVVAKISEIKEAHGMKK
jgi:hypothetical protein